MPASAQIGLSPGRLGSGEPAGNPQTTAQTGHLTTAYDDEDQTDHYDDDDDA